MQSGFAMLEAGTVRIKNLSNIMLKNGEGMQNCIAVARNLPAACWTWAAEPLGSRPAALFCLHTVLRPYSLPCSH